MSDLYQEIILDHYKNPRNHGEIDEPHVYAEDNNPSCGDDMQIHLMLDDTETTVEEIKFTGQGCAISMASGSLMAKSIKGKTIEEIKELERKFREMITSKEDQEELSEELGDLVSLKGVIKFPIRVKCANLSWDTLDKAFQALDEQGIPARAVPNE